MEGGERERPINSECGEAASSGSSCRGRAVLPLALHSLFEGNPIGGVRWVSAAYAGYVTLIISLGRIG